MRRSTDSAPSAEGEEEVPKSRWVPDVAAAVRALPTALRLAARKDPAIAACVMGELLVRALELVGDLDREGDRLQAEEGRREPYRQRYNDLATDFAFARNFDLTAAPDLDTNRVLALVSVCARALDHYLDEAVRGRNRNRDETARDRNRDQTARGRGPARDLARTLDEAARARDLARTRDLDQAALALAGDVARDAARRLDLPTAEGLAAALLDGALDDFTHDDLTGVNSTDPGLNGIQWSQEGTRWPSGTDIEALRRRSRETAPDSGIYVLGRRSGGTSRTGGGVRV